MNGKISKLSKLLLVITAALLLASLFVPIWRIDLQAPQYPEGLVLKIYADKLGGNVEIINGLNHYIGMQSLHASNFIEFTILRYIIIAYVLLMIVAFLKGTRRWYGIAFFGLVLFGIVAMADFWRWEYNYGHHLDPNAAIVVPGMAYQPPLIGFKQLLNFGAYAIPDTGGWLFVAAGILLLLGFITEYRLIKRAMPSTAAMITAFSLIALVSCAPNGPEPIRFNADKCENCKMTISDKRFPAELITKKGRVYKFDDLHCLQRFHASFNDVEVKTFLAACYGNSNQLFDATTGWFVIHESVKSPMQGNIAAFANEPEARQFAEKLNAKTINWTELNKN